MHQPGGQIQALDEAKAAINMLSPLLLDSKGQKIDVSVLPEGTEVVDLLLRALHVAGEANLRLGRGKDAFKMFERMKNLAPTSIQACAGYASALCDVERVEEAKEVLTALEKGGQKNTVDEVTMLGVAWLHTDDRAKAKQMLRSAWSRGGSPYEYALSFVDHYSNARSPNAVGEQVDGYNEAMKFLRECGRGGGNARDPRYRYQVVLMFEELHFHDLLYAPTRLVDHKEGAVTSDAVAAGSGDPMMTLNGSSEHAAIGPSYYYSSSSTYWSHYKVDEVVAKLIAPEVAKLKQASSSLIPDEMVMAALHQLSKDEPNPERVQVLKRLYQYKTRELFDNGTITTGPHLLFEKPLTYALKEWEDLNTEHPNIPDVLIHLARTKSQTGRLQQARELAQQAAALDGGVVAVIFDAALSNPVKLDHTTACPPALLAHTDSMIKCAEMMEDRGAKVCELELWDLYAEEIVHVSHALMVRAAVLVMRGNNQAKNYQAVERIGLPIEKLIVGIIPTLNPSSIVYIELRFLYQYLVQELLTALVVMHEDAIVVSPTNIQVSHKAVGPYERLHKQLIDDCNNIASIPEDLPKRLLEVTKIGVILRPTDSMYWQNLANAHLVCAHKLNLPKAEQAEHLNEAVRGFKTSFKFEGKPAWDDPRWTLGGSAPNPSYPSLANLSSLYSSISEDTEETGIDLRSKSLNPLGSKQIMDHLAQERLDATKKPAARRSSMTVPKGKKLTAAQSLRRASVQMRNPLMTKMGAAVETITTTQNEADNGVKKKSFGKYFAQFNEDVPVAITNKKCHMARIELLHTLTELLGANDPTVLSECRALYEDVLQSKARSAEVWINFAKVQFERTAMDAQGAQDAIKCFDKYPAPVDLNKPTLDDAHVHKDLIKYMMLEAGVDLSVEVPTSPRLPEYLVRDPRFKRSLIIVARSPLGWPHIDKVVKILSDDGHKEEVKAVYEEAMKDSGVSDFEQTKYMKLRGWVAKFAVVENTFTRALDDEEN